MFERLRLYMLPIFAQSIRRAQRLAIAMEAKRFQIGADRTYYYPTRYQPIDAVFSLVLISFSVGRSEERRVGKECRSEWSHGQSQADKSDKRAAAQYS